MTVRNANGKFHKGSAFIMAKPVLTCSKCSAEIELDGKVSELSVICPNCGKKIIVPKQFQKRSKAGLVVAIIVVALGAGGGGLFLKR